MKNKIVLVFLFSLLIPIHFIFASVTYSGAPLGSQLNPINITTGGSSGVIYSGAPLGSSINPIYIQNSPSYNYNTSYKLPNGYKCLYVNISEYERDRIVALKNVETELSKGKTGSSFKGLDYEALYLYKGWLATSFYKYSSNCSNIDSTISSFKATWSEKVSTILDQVKINTPICSTGTVLKNNECISYTEDCRLTFGINVLGTVGLNNNSNCNCISGYESKNNWKQGDAQCLPIIEKTNKKNITTIEEKKDVIPQVNLSLVKTNYQICNEGRPNSNWDGVEVDKNGNLNCPCIANYRWNEKTENCVEINDQSCKDLDLNTKMIITLDSLRSCQCISGYEMNKENTCIVVSVKTLGLIEHKSLWSRIKGWFGF